MIAEKYIVNDKEYNLINAVALIQSGKWNDALKDIAKVCSISEEAARQVGIEIKRSISEHRENINKNISELKANLLVNSGYSFEGYKIKKYLGAVCSEATIGSGMIAEVASDIGDLMGSETTVFNSKIQSARNAAYERIVEKVLDLEGNAIIGLKYDYFVLKSNIICVCIQGTAVLIEEQ